MHVFLILMAPCAAWAHDAGGEAHAYGWNLDPWIVGLLLASAFLYVLGVRRLWRKAGRGRGITARQAALFGAGWTVLALALLSPVDTLGGELFWVHMVQHELLMVVAAPLFVLSRPLEAWAWALGPRWSAAVASFARYPPVDGIWRVLTDPLGAWVFHAAALWVWHIPALFTIALLDDDVHTLQHATFLASALCFWWSVLQPRGRPDGMGLASVFTTMLHTGALGALLTFGPRPWYEVYQATGQYGLTLLEDQQLGGLVMWVPGGLAYLVAGLCLASAWLVSPPERAQR